VHLPLFQFYEFQKSKNLAIRNQLFMAVCFYFFEINKIERGGGAQKNLLYFVSILAFGLSRVLGKRHKRHKGI
jgi:hypothetical protein